MDRMIAVRGELAERKEAAGDEALKKQIAAVDEKLDTVRKRIVATTEGGAITGEERLREHTDTLYGAIMSYDGAPTAYQVERIGVLESELASIDAEFNAVLDKELPALNAALKAAGLPEVEVPPATAAVADSGPRSGDMRGRDADGDEAEAYHSLPTSMVVFH